MLPKLNLTPQIIYGGDRISKKAVNTSFNGHFIQPVSRQSHDPGGPTSVSGTKQALSTGLDPGVLYSYDDVD